MKKRAAKPKVKRLKLTPDSVVTVAVPKGLVPVVATDPTNRVVNIIPVKDVKEPWYVRLFG